MEIVYKNIKKASITNSILVIVIAILRLSQFNIMTTLEKVESIICMLTLLFGVFYILAGYKKDSVYYYKTFIFLYAICVIVSFFVPFRSLIINEMFIDSIIMAICILLIFICILALAFVKNLGKEKSFKLAYLILALNIVKLLTYLIAQPTLLMISFVFSHILLACILCIFIVCKYNDKFLRGTE